MPVELFYFMGAKRVPMMARFVPPGGRYGSNGRLVNDRAIFNDKVGPMVEFYDLRYKGADEKTREYGQYIGAYHLGTLVRRRDYLSQGGLCQDDRVPEWDIGPEAMADLLLWAEENAAKLDKASAPRSRAPRP